MSLSDKWKQDPGEMADSRTRTENSPDEPNKSHFPGNNGMCKIKIFGIIKGREMKRNISFLSNVNRAL